MLWVKGRLKWRETGRLRLEVQSTKVVAPETRFQLSHFLTFFRSKLHFFFLRKTLHSFRRSVVIHIN